jgi:cephalosporin hydroxylase
MKRIRRKLKAMLGKPSKSPVGRDAVGTLALDGLQEPARTLALDAQARFGRGEFVDALRLVERALAASDSARSLNYLHGCCLDRVGRHEEALAAYEKELRIQPDHAATRARAGQLRQALARPERPKLATRDRPYHTSLPREALLIIQQSLHNYMYRGVPMLKDPFDMALYPMLLWQLKPRTIFEIGSKSGGSGLWFGDLLNSFQLETHVYSVDIVRVDSVTHPRVTFLEGDGRRLGACWSESFLRGLPRPWLVIEDADHVYETSSAVLRFFHPWLQAGEYIVVEDGIISDLAQIPDCDSGPHRAIKEFLGTHGNEYEIDGDYCDFFGYNVTWSSNGFLRKKAPLPGAGTRPGTSPVVT